MGQRTARKCEWGPEVQRGGGSLPTLATRNDKKMKQRAAGGEESERAGGGQSVAWQLTRCAHGAATWSWSTLLQAPFIAPCWGSYFLLSHTALHTALHNALRVLPAQGGAAGCECPGRAAPRALPSRLWHCGELGGPQRAQPPGQHAGLVPRPAKCVCSPRAAPSSLRPGTFIAALPAAPGHCAPLPALCPSPRTSQSLTHTPASPCPPLLGRQNAG